MEVLANFWPTFQVEDLPAGRQATRQDCQKFYCMLRTTAKLTRLKKSISRKPKTNFRDVLLNIFIFYQATVFSKY
ncbi:hypothetical protein C4572_02265 [Candidatus Parcubacteria bacterium]|nr:MAG: hypothetical protein C4572_02265 [Candidatus Parcubacteria bacterium]